MTGPITAGRNMAPNTAGTVRATATEISTVDQDMAVGTAIDIAILATIIGVVDTSHGGVIHATRIMTVTNRRTAMTGGTAIDN